MNTKIEMFIQEILTQKAQHYTAWQQATDNIQNFLNTEGYIGCDYLKGQRYLQSFHSGAMAALAEIERKCNA